MSDGPDIIGGDIANMPGARLKRPVGPGGVLQDAPLQGRVWSHGLALCDFTDETAVDAVVTVPYGLPTDAAPLYYHLCFVAFAFRSVTFVSPQLIALLLHDAAPTAFRAVADAPSPAQRRPPLTGVVLDVGHMACTAVPFIAGRCVYDAVRRLPLGGHHLSLVLKRCVSLTQVDLSDDELLVEAMKRATARTAADPADYRASVRRLKGDHTVVLTARQRPRQGDSDDDAAPPPPDAVSDGIRRYQLPVFADSPHLGCLAPPEWIPPTDEDGQPLLNSYVQLRHEPLTVGEALFRPALLGGAVMVGDWSMPSGGHGGALDKGLSSLPAAGVGALVEDSVRAALPVSLAGALWGNVVLTGGTSQIDGFAPRVGRELRASAASAVECVVSAAPSVPPANAVRFLTQCFAPDTRPTEPTDMKPQQKKKRTEKQESEAAVLLRPLIAARRIPANSARTDHRGEVAIAEMFAVLL